MLLNYLSNWRCGSRLHTELYPFHMLGLSLQVHHHDLTLNPKHHYQLQRKHLQRVRKMNAKSRDQKVEINDQCYWLNDCDIIVRILSFVWKSNVIICCMIMDLFTTTCCFISQLNKQFAIIHTLPLDKMHTLLMMDVMVRPRKTVLYL